MSNRNAYDQDLAALCEAVRAMGTAAADAMDAAAKALCEGDTEAAKAIQAGDAKIDGMERDIEHRCMTLLLRQQPVAGDLRRVSAALKLVSDIERIGDHAADISEISLQLPAQAVQSAAASGAVAMHKAAEAMVRNALDAFLTENAEMAAAVRDADDEVDARFDAIKRLLAADIAAHPDQVDAALDWLMIAKYLERVADHAVNIAEWVLFLKNGTYKGEVLL